MQVWLIFCVVVNAAFCGLNVYAIVDLNGGAWNWFAAFTCGAVSLLHMALLIRAQ